MTKKNVRKIQILIAYLSFLSLFLYYLLPIPREKNLIKDCQEDCKKINQKFYLFSEGPTDYQHFASNESVCICLNENGEPNFVQGSPYNSALNKFEL